MTDQIPRGKYIGTALVLRDTDGKPMTEADHFIKCEACGGMIDCRDLGAVFDHEVPLPHPTQDLPQ